VSLFSDSLSQKDAITSFQTSSLLQTTLVPRRVLSMVDGDLIYEQAGLRNSVINVEDDVYAYTRSREMTK
jgi:hypothetical protein